MSGSVSGVFAGAAATAAGAVRAGAVAAGTGSAIAASGVRTVNTADRTTARVRFRTAEGDAAFIRGVLTVTAAG